MYNQDNVSLQSPDIAGLPEHPNDVERFIEISGVTEDGRLKARVLLRYFIQYADGTSEDLDELTFEKPVVQVFKHAGFINVALDFISRNDKDLRVLWDTLMEYSRPANSVSYLPEEEESGIFMTEDGPKKVYYPMIEIALSPIGKEDNFMLIGHNPVCFYLTPNEPKGEPSVVLLSFVDGTFFVVNDLSPLDESMIKAEVEAEMELNAYGHYSGNR